MKVSRCFAVVVCLVFAQMSLFSQTIYTAVAPGVWESPTSWVPAGIPGPNDSVIIARTVTISSQQIVRGFSLHDATILFRGFNPSLTITRGATWHDSGEMDGGKGPNGTDTVNSTFLINAGARLVFESDSTPIIHRLYEGITLVNRGTIILGGNANLGIRGLAVLKNEGLIEVVSDADFHGVSFSGGYLVNSGTFRKIGGADITSFSLWWIFQNIGGTVDVRSGTLELDCDGIFDGGNYNAVSGSVLRFGSRVKTFKGVLSGAPVGTVAIGNSTINIDSTGASLNFQGAGFQWVDGDITGGNVLTVLNGSLLVINGNSASETPRLDGGTTLSNQGTVRFGGTSNFYAQGNSVVDNRSLFEIISDADFTGGPGTGGTFVNKGTLRKHNSNGVSQADGWWGFTNDSSGVIDAASGELEYTSNFLTMTGSVIKGNAAIDFPTSFTNNGITSPGNGIGVLSYISNYAPSATGVLDLQLGGPVVGSGYDRLNVTGNATLGGKLKVRLANSYVPVARDSFTVLTTTGNVNGNFGTFDIESGLHLSVHVNANNVTLVVDSVGTLAVEELTGGEIVNEFGLSQNYPNPFNPSTKISFSIPHSTAVSLKVFDILGKEVATLVNESMNAGNYVATFDAQGLSSGVYFYRIQAGGFAQTKKLAVQK